jgi:MtN3 and saliva related transmembrane protein
MDTIQILGLLAATLTTISFFPQAYKVIRTRNTQGISLLMYVILVVGVFLWLLYGIVKSDLPIILANIVTLIPTLVILFLKVRELIKRKV